jgi:hypothetical protein
MRACKQHTCSGTGARAIDSGTKLAERNLAGIDISEAFKKLVILV